MRLWCMLSPPDDCSRAPATFRLVLWNRFREDLDATRICMLNEAPRLMTTRVPYFAVAPDLSLGANDNLIVGLFRSAAGGVSSILNLSPKDIPMLRSFVYVITRDQWI